MARGESKQWATAIEVALSFGFALVLIHIANSFTGGRLLNFGILPRTQWGLIGILGAPLLHGSNMHLFANLVPLVTLTIVLFSDRKYHPTTTLALIWIVSGLGTWAIGRGASIHVGASGLIFGLAAFLIACGIFARRWRAALVAVIIGFLYGGIFLGVLPSTGPISWEGHLCGAVAGVGAAWRHR